MDVISGDIERVLHRSRIGRASAVSRDGHCFGERRFVMGTFPERVVISGIGQTVAVAAGVADHVLVNRAFNEGSGHRFGQPQNRCDEAKTPGTAPTTLVATYG
jgi:hypothetical protein